jgi:hypothetical protein
MHGEMLVRKQLQTAGLRDHAGEKLARHVVANSRARLGEKVEWSKLGSGTSIARNQRNNRL